MTSPTPHTPAAEVDITPELIRHLLARQHPDLQTQNIQIMEAGWDNVMARLGDNLALRLPRRAAAEPLILNEQKWLPKLASKLPLPIPVPLRVGKPQTGYPFHWSLQAWLPGSAADTAPPKSDQAPVLAGFLKTLHALPLPRQPPRNPIRECSLAAKHEDLQGRMDSLSQETGLITPDIKAAWMRACAAPYEGPPGWIAGDMHPRNILTVEGKLSAIIDWGDMCAGDPATDFMGVWGLFKDAGARDAVFKAYGADEGLHLRALGWAIFSGVILAQTGRIDTPRHAKTGAQILRRIDADLQAA